MNEFFIFPYKDRFYQLTKLTSGTLHFLNFELDKNGEKRFRPISEVFEKLNKVNINDKSGAYRIFHLCYEFGFFFNKIEDEVDPESPLLIELEFSCCKQIKIIPTNTLLKLTPKNLPLYDDYEKAFNSGMNYLSNGDCYQFNLSIKSDYQFTNNGNAMNLVENFWGAKDSIVGPYGSTTYIKEWNLFLLSQSPECLFQLDPSNKAIESMPIKGTLSLNDKTLFEAKNILGRSQKDENELYMITDLMRNDLTKINLSPSKIIKKKEFLHGPNIIHTFSKISSILKKNTSLLTILNSTFPGGSITGAPKIRVMKILREIENRNRRYFCGSTILWFDQLKASSINIRTMEFNLKTLVMNYQSGGGVTIRSNLLEEWNEAIIKRDSYIKEYL